ncbi:MAG: hypothetical protein AAGH99_09885 [Planctomycetota bacterium]
MQDLNKSSYDHKQSELLEKEISEWRRNLRGCDRAQMDELEDHLREELRCINETAPSMREQVVVAADRVGRPIPAKPIEFEASGLQIGLPLGLWFCSLIVLTTVGVLLALNGVRELFNEIDEGLESMIGDNLADLAEPITQVLVVILVVLIGVGAGWYGFRRKGLTLTLN